MTDSLKIIDPIVGINMSIKYGTKNAQIADGCNLAESKGVENSYCSCSPPHPCSPPPAACLCRHCQRGSPPCFLHAPPHRFHCRFPCSVTALQHMQLNVRADILFPAVKSLLGTSCMGSDTARGDPVFRCFVIKRSSYTESWLVPS